MLEWKMITQLLNKAVSEGQDHTAANDEILSFGFMEKLTDSDQCVRTCRMCDLMRSRCCNCVLFTQPEVNKKINASRAVWRWTKRVLFLVLFKRFYWWVRGLMTKLLCRSSFHLKSNKHLGKTPEWRRAEWGRKGVCRRWARYLTCNLLIKRRLKSVLA